MELYNDVYSFKGYSNCDSICHLLIERVGKKEVIVTFTELETNQGTSVTNCSEQLATEVVATFGLNPSATEFFERYRYQVGRREAQQMDTLDRVSYTWIEIHGKKIATLPEWSRVTLI